MKTRTLELDAIPVMVDGELRFHINGQVTLAPEDTEVELTAVVSADDITLPVSQLPHLLKEFLEGVLLVRARNIISSPTYDWMD